MFCDNSLDIGSNDLSLPLSFDINTRLPEEQGLQVRQWSEASEPLGGTGLMGAPCILGGG